MNFDDYCDDMLDLNISLCSAERKREVLEMYRSYLKAIKQKQKQKEVKTFCNVKIKTLIGSDKQKEWAEKIRDEFLASDKISEEQKTELLKEKIAQKAKFWIDNRNVDISYLSVETLLFQRDELGELYKKHYDNLTRSDKSHMRCVARKEIYELLKTFKIALFYDLVNCGFLYDENKTLKKDLKNF